MVNSVRNDQSSKKEVRKSLKPSVAKPLPEHIYRRIYSKVPRLCVDIIIRVGDGVVLVKRDIPPSKGYWHFPGGTVRFGESLSEAAERVALDETGLRVTIVKQVGVIEYSRRSGFGHAVSIAYSATRISGKIRGNKYGRDVKIFRRMPAGVIPEQRKLLQTILPASNTPSLGR